MAESMLMEPVAGKEIDEEEGRRRSTSSINSLASGIEATDTKEHDRSMSWSERWEDSKGMLLVLVSETCQTGMATAARVLELGDGGMTTLQILFVRFSITFILSTLYMYFNSTPDFPLGKKEVRPLLALRGFGGFIGVSGFYYGLQFMPIAEAVTLGFLIPLFTNFACSLFLHQPFDTRQLYAGLVCFSGVVVIARPDQIWFGSSEQPQDEGLPPVSPVQHLIAVISILVSNLGGTTAYTTIRVIGTRVHPLISVNYYALISTILSGAFIFIPALPSSFRLPRDGREWLLMLGIGVFGFGLQFLMTKGLVKDMSPRATNMMYSSVVFGIVMDWTIWGVMPVWSSWLGGAIVIAATVWIAMSKPETEKKEKYTLVDSEDDER